MEEGDAQDVQAEVEARLRALLAAGVTPSRAAREVSEALGVRRRDVYATAQRIEDVKD